MKILRNIISTVCLLAAALTMTAQTDASASTDIPKREHRAVWISPFLTANWPSTAITESNASVIKANLTKILTGFKNQNINIVYYHVRSNCDANYKSSYEPWSAKVSGKRGVAPCFDPFEYLLGECHRLGIEVYAWFNPYRYASSTSKNPYGEGELNYENSHPEWLLFNAKQSVLNPALPEVEKRIVDVISEVVTNYDVDGVIFDDYFYGQGGTDMSADATQYKQYTDAGGTMSQADWRRDNVNRMVKAVNKAIKAIKPYVCFGISPAGVASPPDVTTKYGLPAISGDWQYNQIYSDPLAWLKAGDIDFISPQIYWPNRFTELEQWWSDAAVKFNRHLYASVDISSLGTYSTAEFVHEVETSRGIQPQNTAGMVFFEYNNFVNYRERLFDKMRSFGENLQLAVYCDKALTPLRPWNNDPRPVMTSNIRIADGKLLWDAVDAGRYTVYAYPKSETAPFGGGQQYLYAISYTNSYTLPADYDDYDWFVAVYDRYGNEYSPLGVGAVPGTANPPVLTYPADKEKPVDMFNFAWTAEKPGIFVVEVSETNDFASIFGTVTTTAASASVTDLPALTTGKTYYWRVRHIPVGAPEVCSAVRSFVASRIALTAPAHQAAGLSLTPTLKWTKAADGAQYTLELSRNENFSTINHSAETSADSHTVPEAKLFSGMKYYARVTATLNGKQSVSDVISFSTANVDYDAPVFVSPSASGVTLHCNEAISFKPCNGMYSLTVNISASSSFPTRSSYTSTLYNFETSDKPLGEVKISSKNLENGKTYYLRARGSYYNTASSTPKHTPYTETMTFVYDESAGVTDVTADDSAKTYVTADGTLFAPAGTAVTVYTVDGVLMLSAVSEGSLSLSALPRGAYIIRTAGVSLKWLH